MPLQLEGGITLVQGFPTCGMPTSSGTWSAARWCSKTYCDKNVVIRRLKMQINSYLVVWS